MDTQRHEGEDRYKADDAPVQIIHSAPCLPVFEISEPRSEGQLASLSPQNLETLQLGAYD
jgi:hypothetical protein